MIIGMLCVAVVVLIGVVAGLCAVIAADRRIITALMKRDGVETDEAPVRTGVISPYREIKIVKSDNAEK